MENKIKVFENRQVRTLWNAEEEEWYFSVIDVVAVLTDSVNPRKYWAVLKTRLKAEGSELATNCSQLKMQNTSVQRVACALIACCPINFTSVFVSLIASNSAMIRMLSGAIFSANTLKSLFLSVCAIFCFLRILNFAFFGQEAKEA